MIFQDGSTMWQTNTAVSSGLSAVLKMEMSGDLVLRDSTGQLLWHTDTVGEELRAKVKGTGTFAVEDPNSQTTIWSS